MLGTVTVDDDALLHAAGPLGHMPAYGTAHLSMLVLLVLAGTGLCPGPPHRAAAGGAVAAAGGLAAAGQLDLLDPVGFLPWAWDLNESLPLHYSTRCGSCPHRAHLAGPVGDRHQLVLGLTLNCSRCSRRM